MQHIPSDILKRYEKGFGFIQRDYLRCHTYRLELVKRSSYRQDNQRQGKC
jgi:hypothetical protein